MKGSLVGALLRGVLRMIKAHDRGQVPALAVADQLARINNGVSLDFADKSVGPRCIVAWRYRKDDILKRSGSHQFYTGSARDISSPSIPTIAGEFDFNAIIGVITPHLNKIAQAR